MKTGWQTATLRMGMGLLLILATRAMSLAAVDASATFPMPGCAPGKLAIDAGGTLYVTDPWGRQVLLLDGNGTVVDRFTPSATVQPTAIALLSGGGLALSDPTRGAVDLYNSLHQYQRSLGAGTGEFLQPNDIAVHAATGNLYVVDTNRHQVRVYNAAGALTSTFGSKGSGAGQLLYPSSIAIPAGGTEVFVGDQMNCRVQVFDLSGTPRRTFGTRGSLPGQYVLVQGVEAEPSGLVFVADSFQNQVQLVDGATGTFQVQLGRMGLSPGEGLLQPLDVLLDRPRMRLLVTSHNTESIEIFDVTGIIPDTSSIPDWALLD